MKRTLKTMISVMIRLRFVTILVLMGTTIPCRAQERTGSFNDKRSSSFTLIGTESVANAHQGPVLGIRFSDDGSVCVSAGEDGRVSAWDGHNLKRLGSFRNHKHMVYDISFQDNSHFLTSSADGTIRGWEIGREDETLIIRPNAGYISTLRFANDRIWFLASSDCFCWSLSKTEKLFEGAYALALSDDNRFACVGLSSGHIKVFSLSTNKVTQSQDLIEKGVTTAVSNLSWSAMSNYIAIVTRLRNANELYIYDLEKNTVEHVKQAENPGISTAQFTSDGSSVICAGSSLSIVDVESKQAFVLAVPPDDSETVLNSFTASPSYFTAFDMHELDGRTVIVAGNADGGINRWTLEDSRSKQ